jgi:hypothetical protein
MYLNIKNILKNNRNHTPIILNLIIKCYLDTLIS